MAQRSITKPTAAAVVYPTNHRASVDCYTIQNLTDAALVVKVTAGAIQREAVTYSDPAAGALSLVANAVGEVNQPVTALEFSGTGTGKVNIVEQF
jgi:hypothetical protein